MYIRALLFLHVLGAIVGFGPTFVFPLVGKMMPGSGPERAAALLQVNHRIQKFLTDPVALFLQPLTGVLLIFALGLHRTLPEPWWLTIALVLYVIAVGVSHGVAAPALKRMIRISKGEEGSPAEMPALGRKAARAGGVLHVLLLVIIFLMVVKPGY